METIHDRLEYLINRLFDSKTAAARALGVSRAYISNMTTGKKNVSGDIITKISESLPLVNIDWLYHGRGKMIWTDPEPSGEVEGGTLQEPSVVYIQPARPVAGNAKEVSRKELLEQLAHLVSDVDAVLAWKAEMEMWRKEVASEVRRIGKGGEDIET